ncbi:MAG: CinA family protein [Oscillospiraceae bacterium]|nr:CinA family protein [Oscillospiraceae bacterium]
MEEIYGNIRKLSEEIVRECAARGYKISTAESCTGGMIAAAVTAISGSSAVIELGICSYSNRIKNELLGVSEETLRKFTEYSLPCAEEMAKGAVTVSGADFAVSTSGVAGPTGGTAENPIGTVYIAVFGKSVSESKRFEFENNGRDHIRTAATEKALEMLLRIIKSKGES